MNLLFVCTGNVSRSFLAQALMQKEAEEAGLDDLHVSSAGLFAHSGSPPDSKMVDYLDTMGLSGGPHRATPLAEDEVARADRILVMERAQKSMIEERWPETRGKVECLGKYIPGAPQADDIADPYGKGPYHYRLVQSQITLAVRSLTRTLVKEMTAAC